MTRNSELNTVCKTAKQETSEVIIGAQVPEGMTRWVTFLSVDNVLAAAGASHLALHVASVNVSNPTKASLIATGNRKMLLNLRATQTSGYRDGIVKVPKKPSNDTPLFSIAGGNWLGVYASVTTANVTCQYYEE